MYHGSACKIERAERFQPAASTPDPVADRIIHECRPEQAENDKCGKLHPLGKRACDQCRSNDCKHHLIDHEQLVRNRSGIIGIRRQSDALEAKPG